MSTRHRSTTGSPLERHRTVRGHAHGCAGLLSGRAHASQVQAGGKQV
jgi:hypothetical protein